MRRFFRFAPKLLHLSAFNKTTKNIIHHSNRDEKDYNGEECMLAETIDEPPTAGIRGLAKDDDSDTTLGGALPTGMTGITATGLEETPLAELAEAEG